MAAETNKYYDVGIYVCGVFSEARIVIGVGKTDAALRGLRFFMDDNPTVPPYRILGEASRVKGVHTGMAARTAGSIPNA